MVIAYVGSLWRVLVLQKPFTPLPKGPLVQVPWADGNFSSLYLVVYYFLTFFFNSIFFSFRSFS